MKKMILALALVSLIPVSIVAGVLLVDLKEAEEEEKLYTYPLWVDSETYVVTVRTNWTSAPEVSYFGLTKSVNVDFRGQRGTVSCNITIPTNLIWGELFVYKHDTKQDYDQYAIFSNATHHSVKMKFCHVATVEIVSVRGTEGILTAPYT